MGSSPESEDEFEFEYDDEFVPEIEVGKSKHQTVKRVRSHLVKRNRRSVLKRNTLKNRKTPKKRSSRNLSQTGHIEESPNPVEPARALPHLNPLVHPRSNEFGNNFISEINHSNCDPMNQIMQFIQTMMTQTNQERNDERQQQFNFFKQLHEEHLAFTERENDKYRELIGSCCGKRNELSDVESPPRRNNLYVPM